MKIVLEIIAGPEQGGRLECEGHGTVLIGRASAAQLRLNDPHFSRHHMLLETNPPHCYLRDLGSSNGTLVNGQRVKECRLREGDIISGGQTRIRFSLATEPNESTVAYENLDAATADLDPTTVPPTGAAGVRQPTVPGYEIVRELGRGGMGVVYHAQRQATGEDVALKVIMPESAASDKAMRFFLREISVLSKLDHPRIVRFHEMGISQGQFFFAMEYVAAVALADILANQTEAARTKTYCAIICQVLEGLSHAHGLGFVHRDIKPANILASRDGKKLRTKLADFGLAKNFENAGFSGMTCEGQAMGTLAFMAPEQLENARDVGPLVDIYSVGATLYYYLAKRPAHDFHRGKDAFLVALEDEHVPLADVCPDLPAGLSELIGRALAREPVNRFPNAEAMRKALLPYAKGQAGA